MLILTRHAEMRFTDWTALEKFLKESNYDQDVVKDMMNTLRRGKTWCQIMVGHKVTFSIEVK